MPRERLPNRRRSEVLTVEHVGRTYEVAVGYFPDGRPGEVFVSGAKTGSDTDGLLADLGVLISRALQHGDSIEALASGMGRLGDRRTPSSITGAILDALADVTATA